MFPRDTDVNNQKGHELVSVDDFGDVKYSNTKMVTASCSVL